MKNIIRICLLLLVSFIAKAHIDKGEVPPQIVGKLVNGDEVNLSDYKGKVVALTFWATWCTYCLEEMPVLANIQMKLGTDQFRVIAVNYKEDRKVFKSVEKKTREYNMIMAHDKYGDYGENFGVSGFPLLYLIDHHGKVAFRHQGYNQKTQEKIINEIIYLVDNRNKEMESLEAGK